MNEKMKAAELATQLLIETMKKNSYAPRYYLDPPKGYTGKISDWTKTVCEDYQAIYETIFSSLQSDSKVSLK